jgi:hypothetical protein
MPTPSPLWRDSDPVRGWQPGAAHAGSSFSGPASSACTWAHKQVWVTDSRFQQVERLANPNQLWANLLQIGDRQLGKILAIM